MLEACRENDRHVRRRNNEIARSTLILVISKRGSVAELEQMSGVDGGSVLDNIPLQNQEGTGEGILDQLQPQTIPQPDTGEPQVPTTQ